MHEEVDHVLELVRQDRVVSKRARSEHVGVHVEHGPFVAKPIDGSGEQVTRREVPAYTWKAAVEDREPQATRQIAKGVLKQRQGVCLEDTGRSGEGTRRNGGAVLDVQQEVRARVPERCRGLEVGAVRLVNDPELTLGTDLLCNVPSDRPRHRRTAGIAKAAGDSHFVPIGRHDQAELLLQGAGFTTRLGRTDQRRLRQHHKGQAKQHQAL